MDAAIAPPGAVRQLESGCLQIGNCHHGICRRLSGELIRNQRGGKVAQIAVRERGQIAEFMQLIEFQGIKSWKPIQFRKNLNNGERLEIELLKPGRRSQERGKIFRFPHFLQVEIGDAGEKRGDVAILFPTQVEDAQAGERNIVPGNRGNPKFCVTAKSGANRVKFIMGGRRVKRLPPCLQHNASGTGCQGGAIISPQPSI